MRIIRTHMRASSASVLSVPHFRTLRYLSVNPGCPLSEVAEFIGLSTPSASKIVQSLIRRGFLLRKGDPQDRRRSVLEVSARGHKVLQNAREDTHAKLAEHLAPLDEAQRLQLIEALAPLRQVFSPDSVQSKSLPDKIPQHPPADQRRRRTGNREATHA